MVVWNGGRNVRWSSLGWGERQQLLGGLISLSLWGEGSQNIIKDCQFILSRDEWCFSQGLRKSWLTVHVRWDSLFLVIAVPVTLQAECFPSGVVNSPEIASNYLHISNIQPFSLPTSCASKPFLSSMQFGFVEVSRGYLKFFCWFGFSFFFLFF